MEPLTNEQLCLLAQAGDEEAQSQLIENSKTFVYDTAKRFAGNPSWRELFSACGIEVDDLTPAGLIGLWRASGDYNPSRENNFLTYTTPAIRRAMIDLVRQYGQDAVWRLKHNQAHPWKIVCLDEPLDDAEEDTVESLVASPNTKLPEQICIERETAAELHEAMDALSDRETVYVRYLFGFVDGEAHPLTETTQYFRLIKRRTKGIERSALKLLKHELLVEITERAVIRAEDRLTRLLVAEGELHSVELRLKPQKKRGRKITATVYEYLADCSGKWGELRYNFMDDTAEVLLLAKWETMVRHRFALRAIEYLREHSRDALLDKIVLTFIGLEQKSYYLGYI